MPIGEQEIEDALKRVALGGTYDSTRISEVTDEAGNVMRKVKVGERRNVAPDASLLKSLLLERVGGPHDWC